MKRLFVKYSLLTVFLIISFCLLSFAQSDEMTDGTDALTLTNILNGLRSDKATRAQRTQLLTKGADERGVGFELTPDVERQIRSAGATQALIDAIRRGSSRFYYDRGRAALSRAYEYKRVPETRNKALDQALGDLNTAIKLNPNSPFWSSEYYCARAQVYFEKQNNDDALADVNQGIFLSSKAANQTRKSVLSNLYYVRGNVYEKKREYVKAIDDLTKSIELTKFSVDLSYSYSARGNVYWTMGNFIQAIVDFDKAISLFAYNDEAYQARCATNNNISMYDEAIADCTKAMQIISSRGASKNKEAEESYYNRGRAYEGKNDVDRAIADYRKALEINPNSETAKERLNLLLKKKK